MPGTVLNAGYTSINNMLFLFSQSPQFQGVEMGQREKPMLSIPQGECSEGETHSGVMGAQRRELRVSGPHLVKMSFVWVLQDE